MKKPVMKHIGSLLLGTSLALGISAGAFASEGSGPPSGLNCPDGMNIVVHLKRHINDLQGANIAVRLATLMENQSIDMPGKRPDKPVNVTLFLTLQGPMLVDPAQPQDLAFGSAPQTLEQVTKGFLSAGGKILACPLCATELGLEAGELLDYGYPDQVKIATNADLVSTFLCADKILDF